MDWRGEQCCNWEGGSAGIGAKPSGCNKCDRAVNTSSRPNPVLSNCEEKIGDGLSIMSDLFIFHFFRVLLKPGNAEHGNTPRSQRTLYQKKEKD